MPDKSSLTQLGLLFALIFGAGCHRPRGESFDRLLIGEIMMHSELGANLRKLSVPGGRLTGTPNAEQAVQLVADKLRAYGLKNVHLEPFEMSCWTVHDTRVTLLDDPPRTLAGAVALARTLCTPPEGVTAELADLGEGREEDFAARQDQLAGRFALLRDSRARGPKIKQAISGGAAGVVFMSSVDRQPTIGNGHEQPRPEPVVVIPHDEDLLGRLERGESLRLNIHLDAENWPCRPSNLIGDIPGRGPLAREFVILCAHLDSWHLGQGALDNSSGAAAILETARALTRVGWQPRRTVRFVWFMAEELGLAGSEAYVQAHQDELDRVVAVINVDMPGSPRKFGVFGHPEIETFLQTVRVDLAGYELDEQIGQWKWEASDHYPFMKAGVCALSLSGEHGPGVKHYHTAGDTYETVDRRATVQSSAVLAVLARRLADAPQRPSVRQLPE